MTSLFTDPEAAVEEAEYLANSTKKVHCLIEVVPNGIQVCTKKEALMMDGTILETVNPVDNFSIYD